MKLLSKSAWEPCIYSGRKRSVRYRAIFWNSDTKRHYEQDCDDVLFERSDGTRRFLNTAQNVSYHRELMRAAA